MRPNRKRMWDRSLILASFGWLAMAALAVIW